MIYPLYEQAKKFLMKEYESNFRFVQSSRYYTIYINEKIKHSFQVSGVGNGILMHEAYFKDKNRDFTDIARTAILLHDIYRFREIRGLFEANKHLDHSVCGAQFLKETKDFNNILITLPIKHHGHMIEALYEDEEYQKQDIATQEDVKNISFAVRDADKIANWHFLCHEWDAIKDVWMEYPDDLSAKQGVINDKLWQFFIERKVGPRTLQITNGDRLMLLICWLFDINYAYSIDYSIKLDCFNGLCDLLRKVKVPEERICTVKHIIKDHVFEKFDKVTF